MDNIELKKRTQKFSLDIIKFIENFPRNLAADTLVKQLIRSACSVGVNYRAALSAQSYIHFISKIGTVEEESDESLFWLELIYLSGINKSEKI
jgi:four helix bundle protein